MLEEITTANSSSHSHTLDLLRIVPNSLSKNYVENEQQFQLHSLLTEQRHPKTYALSYEAKKNTAKGLAQILSVDQDITQLCNHLAQDTSQLDSIVQSLVHAIVSGRKIYMYGCGATGRLANQMESTFWRPFWRKLRERDEWKTLEKHFPNIENRLIGEITGGDRALISSLEGFEDLHLIGELQLADHKIQRGDVVFAITEGGETSSVIGAILAAAKLYGESELGLREAQEHLVFFYNNPNKVLYPFNRSRAVLEHKGISKVCISSGPQAIAGSTRMQACTSAGFVIGSLIESLVAELLKSHLSATQLEELQIDPQRTMRERLLSFDLLQRTIAAQSESLSVLSDLEAKTYAHGGFTNYLADEALPTVFVDSTERSPTFRLSPLDPVPEAQRKSWIRVWTPTETQRESWRKFLKRDFRGLEESSYHEQFSSRIPDKYMRGIALNSLKNAGRDQQFCYDFSMFNCIQGAYAPQNGDLGVVIIMGLNGPMIRAEAVKIFLERFSRENAHTVALCIFESELSHDDIFWKLLEEYKTRFVPIYIDRISDPLGLRKHLSLKMLLNAHSSTVMAKLGRVIGNAMINVSPGNLKLIGRATYLIQTHVNQNMGATQLSYAEANAVLFDAMEFTARKKSEQTSEVALSIIRILESWRVRKFVSWEQSENILEQQGLEAYLQNWSS